MPYIKKSDRALLDGNISKLAKSLAECVEMGPNCDGFVGGRLNYTITKLILEYERERTKLIGGTYTLSYSDWNEFIGALECCKLELYRMQIAKYEDEKIAVNGKVE